MREVTCPYCGKRVEINHDDGYGYTEGETYQQECDKCNKTFVYYTTKILCYDVYKAPCLNGEDHCWEDVQGAPEGYQSNRKRCKWCNKDEWKYPELRYDVLKDAWYKPTIEEVK